MPGYLGTDFYRLIIERARDLLTALHNEVIQQQNGETIGTEFVSNEGSTTKKHTVESKLFNMGQAVEISNKRSTSHASNSKSNPPLEPKIVLPDVDEEEYKEAMLCLEKAGRSVNKGHIREFLSFIRPEPIIGKMFQVIAILRGHRNPNWGK